MNFHNCLRDWLESGYNLIIVRERVLPPVHPHDLATGPGRGETYEWRRVEIGGHGFITGYAADQTGQTRVNFTDVYGAYVWRQDLDRWIELANSATSEANHQQDGVNNGLYEVAVALSRPA